jgi:hypothetical protein
MVEPGADVATSVTITTNRHPVVLTPPLTTSDLRHVRSARHR